MQRLINVKKQVPNALFVSKSARPWPYAYMHWYKAIIHVNRDF